MPLLLLLLSAKVWRDSLLPPLSVSVCKLAGGVGSLVCAAIQCLRRQPAFPCESPRWAPHIPKLSYFQHISSPHQNESPAFKM